MKGIIVKENQAGKAYPQLAHIGEPVPKKGEVLVKVMASPLSTACRDTFSSDFKKVAKRIKKGDVVASGIELSGIVASSSEQFKLGDEVVGAIDFVKGVYTHGEYTVVPEEYLALKPTHLTHVEAASMIVGLLTSIEALITLGGLQNGQSILINGATGNLGVYATQLAKLIGARVTATTQPSHFHIAAKYGADETLSYHDDFLSNRKFDMVFDTPGKLTYKNVKAHLNPRGVFVTSNPQKDITGFFTSMFSSKKSKFLFMGHSGKGRMKKWKQLVDHEEIKPVIDQVFKLSEFSVAMNHFKTTSVVGKVVIDMK